jgi:hypothetical protein
VKKVKRNRKSVSLLIQSSKVKETTQIVISMARGGWMKFSGYGYEEANKFTKKNATSDRDRNEKTLNKALDIVVSVFDEDMQKTYGEEEGQVFTHSVLSKEMRGWKDLTGNPRGYLGFNFSKEFQTSKNDLSKGVLTTRFVFTDGKFEIESSYNFPDLQYFEYFTTYTINAPVTRMGSVLDKKKTAKALKECAELAEDQLKWAADPNGDVAKHVEGLIDKNEEGLRLEKERSRLQEEAVSKRQEEIRKKRLETERREKEEAQKRKREEAQRKKEEAERKKEEKARRKQEEARKKQGLSLQDILDSMQGWAAGQFRDKDEPFINGNWVDYLVRTEYYDDDEYAEQAAQNWLDKKLRYEGWTEGKEVETSVDAEEKGWVTVSVSPKRK